MSERLRTGARMLPTTILDQAADEIDRLETHKQQCFDRMRTMTERIAELEERNSYLKSWGDNQYGNLKDRLAKLESNESSIISLLESLETTLCTGEYNDRVANALALIAEIMALANSEVET